MKTFPFKIEIGSIRARIGFGIDARVVTDFGCAFASVMGLGPIVVGRDGRPTGEHYARSVISSMNSVGREVYAVGCAPTATLGVAVRELNCAGGVSITPGPYDEQWSGLQFLDKSGALVSVSMWRRILRAYERKRFRFVSGEKVGAFKMNYSCFGRHIQAVSESPGLDSMDLARAQMTVVVDSNNASPSAALPQFLRCLGVHTLEINGRLNTGFAHLPNLAPANFKALRAEVRKRSAHAGIGVDADGSALTLVDNLGKVVGVERTLMLAARQILRTTAGVIGVEKGALSGLRSLIRALDGRVVDTPPSVAETTVRCRQGQWVAAFLKTGAIVYPPSGYTPDCLSATGLALSDLAKHRGTLADLVTDLPPSRAARK